VNGNRAHIVSHESDLGRWVMATGNPDGLLRPFVNRYQGYHEWTAGSRRRTTIPSANVVLILGYDRGLSLFNPRDESGSPRLLHSFVAGLHDSHGMTEFEGESHGLQVNLDPLGAYLAFGVPMDRLANTVVDLEDLLGRPGADLLERLLQTPTWSESFEIVDAFIAARMADARPASCAVAWAWQTLKRSNGKVSVGSLAQNLGWSRKHLVEQFRHHVGLTPKTMGRILRFDYARRYLESNARMPLTAIARCSGYYDQAHFTRDFVEFTGSTPNQHLARLLPDGGGVATA
jgi:AraC-like DNA-binding protein